ncbi:hypothetical protein MMC16_007338, partial [Acarospora aff. strigata]|nr:hypothetical protein [Acarospora aff. strigata]
MGEVDSVTGVGAVAALELGACAGDEEGGACGLVGRVVTFPLDETDRVELTGDFTALAVDAAVLVFPPAAAVVDRFRTVVVGAGDGGGPV